MNALTIGAYNCVLIMAFSISIRCYIKLKPERPATDDDDDDDYRGNDDDTVQGATFYSFVGDDPFLFFCKNKLNSAVMTDE